MGESACLVRSFSNPSPTSTEGNKGNHPLTTSISFGRFMSESLDWEKWSVFTQNRYLEEAEKYSRPGSVAEKKAYFEAHFKRRRAAALLERQNEAAAAARNIAETSSYPNMKEDEVQPADERTTLEDVKPKEIQQVIEEEDKISEKKPSKWVSPVKVIKLKNSGKTPQSKSRAMELNNKRTSLHMSINFGAIQKDASKVENSRIVRAPAKKYKNSVFPPTSTTACANGLYKHHSHENSSRIMRPHGDSISQAPSSNYFKSSNLSGIKTRTATVPSSFTFKSEERAVKRREKLEQKMKSKEAEKHAKPQVPACFSKIEERRGAFKAVQDNDTRPPWRFSVKTERLNAPRNCVTTKRGMNENVSPNIQL